MSQEMVKYPGMFSRFPFNQTKQQVNSQQKYLTEAYRLPKQPHHRYWSTTFLKCLVICMLKTLLSPNVFGKNFHALYVIVYLEIKIKIRSESIWIFMCGRTILKDKNAFHCFLYSATFLPFQMKCMYFFFRIFAEKCCTWLFCQGLCCIHVQRGLFSCLHRH